jgi:hypothetical protein
MDSATTLQGNGQIRHGSCDPTTSFAACLVEIAAECDGNPTCRSIAFHPLSTSTSAGSNYDYKLMSLGGGSTVQNAAWVAYTKPGRPVPPPPPSPSPPSPSPSPTRAGSEVHKSTTGPGGPFTPVDTLGYGSCNNPSPFQHPNGTLYLACTWSLKHVALLLSLALSASLFRCVSHPPQPMYGEGFGVK